VNYKTSSQSTEQWGGKMRNTNTIKLASRISFLVSTKQRIAAVAQRTHTTETVLSTKTTSSSSHNGQIFILKTIITGLMVYHIFISKISILLPTNCSTN
jgi:hypothetical protein